MSQPNPPSYTAPPATSGELPSDEPASLHPERRAVLAVLRAITYLVYAVVIAAEIILALGFFLLLLGANPSSSFVEWWYRNLDRVMDPFRGIFTPIELGAAQGSEVPSVFETSVLFAMVVYAIVAMLIYTLAQWLGKRLHRLDVEDRMYHERMAYERQAYLDRVSAERVANTNAQTVAQATQQPPTSPNQPPNQPPPGS